MYPRIHLHMSKDMLTSLGAGPVTTSVSLQRVTIEFAALRRQQRELARRITLGHARARVLFYAILWERIAKPIFRQSIHALNCFHQVLRW